MIWNFSFSKNIFCRGLDIRVAQVVEADAAQAVSLQHEAEVARQVFRLHPAAHLVDADVAFVAADVRIPA